MADIVFINPRFPVSYWGREYAMPIIGKQAIQPVASLPLLAALTPSSDTVTLIDENVEEIDFDRCTRADIVGITGMGIQRFRMKEILTELRNRDTFLVVGGPWVTVQEDYFDGLADAVFIGEADTSWPRFLKEWQEGRHGYRYEQIEKTDMTALPTPRFDLLKMSRYLVGCIQISRGCPFRCEFCDIIVTFGRRPRIKNSAQVIAEIEALLAEGIKYSFIVDDNLIANKKVIKTVLRDLIEWQKENRYPITFMTEASIDLADDHEMIELMKQANINRVFIGIESPNEESLRETKKLQNLRTGGTMLEKVHRIQDSGLEVDCGMIVGFDNDDRTIFEAQRRFIQESRISHVMLTQLYAIPKTPLHERLNEEGRLDTADVPEFGTNVLPLKMTSQEMRDGYIQLINDLYQPDAYFDRMENLLLRSTYGRNKFDSRRQKPIWDRVNIAVGRLFATAQLFTILMRRIPDPLLRRVYRRRIGKLLLTPRGARWLLKYTYNCILHYHEYRLAEQMASKQGKIHSHFS